jgi:MGT family glycosyltransferase
MALGSHHGWKTHILRPAIEAVADAKVSLLIATGDRLVEDTLGPVPENVRIASWVASRAVLERATVHINHGGASSVHESIVACVPIACVPQADDQHLWADRVATLGVGLRLPTTPTTDEFRDAIRTLLADDAPRQRARELRDHLLAHPGEAIANETVAALLD